MKKLKFERYRVENLSFKQDQDFREDKNLSVSMGSNVEMTGEDSAIVSIICHLESADENFELSIRVSGDFVVEEDETKDNIPGVTNELLLSRNSLSILFPYLRSAISQVTSIGYHNPVVLPPINILDFIQKSKEEEPEK